MQRLSNWFAQIGSDSALAAAQYAELRKQVPLLYILLTVNSVVLCLVYRRQDNIILTGVVPSLLIGIIIIRLLHWRRVADEPIAPHLLAGRLKRTTLLAGLLAGSYVVWTLSLTWHGGEIGRTDMALLIAMTAAGCISCLIHLPQAATIVALVSAPAVALPLFGAHNTLSVPIAINIASIELMMMHVLFINFGRFGELVRSKVALIHKNGDTARLSQLHERLANSDSLTDLPNRRYFYTRLAEMIEISRVESLPLAVGIIDLDDFKQINDLHGHAVGDALLKQVARLVRATLAPNVEFARLGGDEFGLIFVGSAAHCSRIAAVISDCLRHPVEIAGGWTTVAASLGFATYPDMAASGDELMSRADRALYHTKASGRGGHTIFWDELEREAANEQRIEQALRVADLARELNLVFQPIVDLGSREIVAAEALLRWSSPAIGEVAPAVFIPLAERNGLIPEITRHVIGQAMACARHLPAPSALSINISARDLHSPVFVNYLLNQIDNNGVAPSRIWIEVTETAVMHNVAAAAATLHQLRARGIKIALDDFGTGFSSLSYLSQLPIDKIKIDRTFVGGLDDAVNRNIIQAILVLSESLGVECVVEGIETEEQLAYFSRTTCRAAQGFFFARPMAFGQLLASVGGRLLADVQDARRPAVPVHPGLAPVQTAEARRPAKVSTIQQRMAG
jgi:diguanylate cyclase (GGDEF)-like protein